MKTIFALFTVLVSLSAFAGPFVSEGPGPVGDILNCTSAKVAQAKFVIRHTAAVTVIQGYYSRPGQAGVSMICQKDESNAWSCQDISRTGSRKLSARAYRNSQGIVTAQVFSKDMANRPVLEDSLLCK